MGGRTCKLAETFVWLCGNKDPDCLLVSISVCLVAGPPCGPCDEEKATVTGESGSGGRKGMAMIYFYKVGPEPIVLNGVMELWGPHKWC